MCSDSRRPCDFCRNELFWDPKVDNESIAVSADDGKVTLRGTVGSFREKLEAKKAAERVYGVKSVENELEVKLLNGDKREDAELRGDVLQALMLDSLVPKTVDAKVDEGLVTLSGTADWQYQRDEAEFITGNVFGVIAVVDEIGLKPSPSATDVKRSIKDAFKRNAKLDANDLTVTTSNGTATIEGVVSSWAEHDQAVAAAWFSPGVNDVDDQIIVDY